MCLHMQFKEKMSELDGPPRELGFLVLWSSQKAQKLRGSNRTPKLLIPVSTLGIRAWSLNLLSGPILLISKNKNIDVKGKPFIHSSHFFLTLCLVMTEGREKKKERKINHFSCICLGNKKRRKKIIVLLSFVWFV